jgi:hypothetical protein
MSSSNYNAITNLVETVIDYLVVDTAEIDTALIENLDCNVGTIDTLTSTTATLTSANIPTLTTTTAGITTANITTENTTTSNITTANITTSNTTNLNTNNIQPNPVSSAVSLYTTGTGVLTLGNTSNTNALTINQNITLPASKIITLDATGGKIVCNTYEGTAAGTAISLFGTSTSAIGLGNLSGTLTINPNNTQFNGSLTLASSKTITLSNIAGSKILCNTYTGTATSSNLTIGESGNTGTLTIHKTSLICQSISARDTADSVNIFSNHLNTFYINSAANTFPVLIQSNLQVNSTKKLLCNVYTGIETSSNLTIGESGNTGNLVIYKDITSSNTYSGTNTYSGGNTHSGSNTFSGATNTFNNTILVNTLTGTTTGSAISLFGTSTSTIDLGNLSGGVFTINPNTQLNGTLTLASGKNLTLSSTGNLICNTLQGTAITSSINAFNNIVAGAINLGTGLTGSMNIGTSMRNGVLTIGSVSFNPATDTGYAVINIPLYVNQDLNMDTGKNIIMSNSGKITCDEYQATTTTISPKFFTNLTGVSTIIEIGNTSGFGTRINNDLFIGTTKAIACNNLYSYGTTDLNIGTFTSSGYFINLTSDIKVSSGKNLTLSSTGSILCPTYNSTSATQSLLIGNTNTTASITIGGALSSGSINCGLIGMTGNINLRADTSIGTSATNKGLVCNYFSSFNNSDLVRICANLQAGNIRLGETQTTGGITIGHQTPATDSGTLTINKNTVLATNKNLTLGNQSKLVGGTNGTANITAVAYTNVVLFASASVAGFYQVNIYGASATQTYSVCCFLSADNSGAVQNIASRNMTFQFNAPNWCITATVVPTATITMTYNVIRLV